MQLKKRLATSTTALVLFDLTMSYVMAMKDVKMRHMLKHTFNSWEKEGKMLWKLTIKELKNQGHEDAFDDIVIQLNDVFNAFLEAENPQIMLELMQAYNRGEIKVQ